MAISGGNGGDSVVPSARDEAISSDVKNNDQDDKSPSTPSSLATAITPSQLPIVDPLEFMRLGYFRVISEQGEYADRRAQFLTLHVMERVLRACPLQLPFVTALLELVAPGRELANACEGHENADGDAVTGAQPSAASWATTVRGKIFALTIAAISPPPGSGTVARAAARANRRRLQLGGAVDVCVRTLASLNASVLALVARRRALRLQAEDVAEDDGRGAAQSNAHVQSAKEQGQDATADPDDAWYRRQQISNDVVALQCLSVLNALVRHSPAIDRTVIGEGARRVALLSPVSKLKQQLCAPNALALLVSVVGAQHEQLTQRTVGVLNVLLRHHEAVVPNLYRTGLFLHLLQ